MEFRKFEFGGQGNCMHLAVANGFPPNVYRPMIAPFLADYGIVSLLPRALWGDETPPRELISWRAGLARDLYEGITAHDMRDVVAVGHSFGGVASLLAVIRDPARFKALILLDPTLMVPPILEAVEASRLNGDIDAFPLAARAAKRKQIFESHEAALEYFSGKRLFSNWDQEALRLYAYEAFQPIENGVKLVWPAEWEAYYFKTIDTRIWDKVGELNGLLPVLVIRGGDTDTFTEASELKMRELVPDAAYQVIEGHGHLFPMSAPDQTAQRIQAFLQTV